MSSVGKGVKTLAVCGEGVKTVVVDVSFTG